ncbi:hypothetical protein [Halobacterium salinarum]|uniref:Uncharacterized protein n=1 Tax=Halobacterium salinarum (strain ATCC 33171 / DSM 3754 / JCM 8978 / NBRC 102687 / NCIMB 764 / 91-R6) TaxID=2597657 RepID=A0A4D6GSZ6_HALS9|nr:hypothetical protein [Halobacterium salinarum]QCC44855.1 uncharacterized protein HBSAL_05950 [Halobacterium salinarum]TYO75564.1 hypothetical protein APQ99_01887 [Halobacterium salinarum DSM 3754]
MTERTMRSVSQRNPVDPDHAVGTVFRRGPAVVADGGERGVAAAQRPDGGADAEDGGDGEDSQKMKDVDQTPPDEDASANRVWERGGESAPDGDDNSVNDE